MNNFDDITKTGPVGLKGINSKNYPIEASDNIKLLMQDFQHLKIATPEDFALQSLNTLWEPTPITVGLGYGTSKYDKGIMTIDEALNIEAMRGEQLSAAALWLHGITKGGVLAGTTFLQGTLGTIYGLGDMALNIGNKNESGWETISRIWDNDFNDGVEEINQYMEKLLPNYKTMEELNRKWYLNLGTPNFWADTILKQVGFTVGAFYSGRLFTGGLRALGMLSKAPAATAALILYGSFSEGAIEANRNSGDWLNLQTAKINDTRELLKLEIEKQYGDSQGSWIMDLNGNLISEKLYKLNQIDTLADEEILNQKKNASLYGLINLIGSAISTSIADFITFGKMISRGYESASNMAKKTTINKGIQEQFERQATNKFSDNITGKVGLYVWNKIPTKKGIYQGFKGAAFQGIEEMNLLLAANFSGEIQEYDSPNAYYEALTNPDAELETKEFFTAVTNGFMNSYGNKDLWEQFAAAFITSIFGMPTFGRGNNSSDLTYLGNGKLVGLSGGVFGEMKENNIVNKYGEETVAYLNQYMQKFKDDADYFILNQAFTDIMHGWSNTTNAFEYKNFEDNSDFAAINRFASIGKLEDLKEFVNIQYESLSDREIAKIGELAKPASENTNVDGSPKTLTKKGVEEIRKELINKRDKILNNIDSYEKSIRQVRTLLPVNIDKDKESELAWLLWKINRMDERFSEIKEDTKRYRIILNNQIEAIKTDLDINSENEQNKKDAEVQLNNLELVLEMLSNLEKSETSVDFANTILKSKPILEYLNADLFTTEDNTGGILRYTLFDVLDMESIGIDNTRWQNEINKFNDIFKLASLSTLFNNTLKKYIEDLSAQTKNRLNIDNKNAKRNKDKSDKNISEAINNSTTSDNIARVLDGDINIPEVLNLLDNSAVEGSKVAADKLREISKMVDLKEEILSQVQDENLPVSSEIAEILLDLALRTSENIGLMLDVQSEAYNNMLPILERFGEDLDKGIITREEADEATKKAQEVIMVAISKIIDDSATETPLQEDTSKNAQSVKEESSETKDEGASVAPVNQPTVKELENMQSATESDETGTPDITIKELELQQDKQQEEVVKINSINKNSNGKYDFWLSGISEYLMYPTKEERDVIFKDKLSKYSQEEAKSIAAVWDYLDSKGAFLAVKNKKAKGEVLFTVDKDLNNAAEDFIVLINNSEGLIIGALPGLKSSNINNYEYLSLFIENVKKEYQEWESLNPNQVLYTTRFKSHVSKNYIGRPIYTKENHDLNTIFPNGYLLGVINKKNELVGLPENVTNVVSPLGFTFGLSFIIMPTSSTGSREYVCVPFITKKFNENTKDTALGKEIVSFLNSFKNITNTTSPSDMADYKEGLFNRLSFLCIEDDLHLNVDKYNNLIFKRKNKLGGYDTIFKAKLGDNIGDEIIKLLFEGFNGILYGFLVCIKWTNRQLNGLDYNKMIGEVSYTNLKPELYTTSNDFFSINPVGIDGLEIEAKDMRSTRSKVNNQNVKLPVYINNTTYYYNKNTNELIDVKGNTIQDDVLKAVAYTEIFSKKGIVDTPFGKFNTNTLLFENTPTLEETNEGQKSFSIEDTDLNKQTISELSIKSEEPISTVSIQDFNRKEQKILSNLSEEDRDYILSNFEKPIISSKLRLLDNCFDYLTNTYNYSQLGYSDLKSFMEGTKLRKTDNLEYKKWNAKKEARWLHKVLPQLTFDESKQIVKGINGFIQAGNGVYAYGMFKNGLIYIGKNAAKGTMYHEAFHAVANTLLSQEDKDTMFNEASKKYNGKPYMELEELLAEDFRKYVQYSEIPIIGNIINIFRKLKHYILKLRGNELFLDNLFYRINSGLYSNVSPNNYKGTKLSDRGYTQEMQAIKDKAIANGTFMKAPNGKPTNLTERQWIHVRTKAFKEWFGDWESLALLDNVNLFNLTSGFYGKGDNKKDGFIIKDGNLILTPKIYGSGEHTQTRYTHHFTAIHPVIGAHEDWDSSDIILITPYKDIKDAIGNEALNVEPMDIYFGSTKNIEIPIKNVKVIVASEETKNRLINKGFFSENIEVDSVWGNLIKEQSKLDRNDILDEDDWNKNHKAIENRRRELTAKYSISKEEYDRIVKNRGYSSILENGDYSKVPSTHTDSWLNRGEINSTYGTYGLDQLADNIRKGKANTYEIIFGYEIITTNKYKDSEEDTKTIIDAYNNLKNNNSVSKVVDENGEPLVVYHGSPNVFNTFDSSFKRYDVHELGFFFTISEKKATTYGNNVIAAFLNIKNIGESKIEKGDTLKSLRKRENAVLKNPKFDGTKFLTADKEGFNTILYAVKSSNQIKSATDNIGSYSRENDNIYYRKVENYYVDKLRYLNLSEEDKSYLSQHNVPQTIYDSMTQTEKELLWHCKV